MSMRIMSSNPYGPSFTAGKKRLVEETVGKTMKIKGPEQLVKDFKEAIEEDGIKAGKDIVETADKKFKK